MGRKKSETRAERKRFSPEFKQQALLRAAKDGVPAVARELGLESAQLYGWRAKAQQQGDDAEAQRVQQTDRTGASEPRTMARKRGKRRRKVTQPGHVAHFHSP